MIFMFINLSKLFFFSSHKSIVFKHGFLYQWEKKRQQQKQTNETVVSRHSLHPQAAHALFAEGERPTA
jgi:hypothetical protein